MSKITADHLSLSAFVYVRQSTAYQVANNLESQRRQYGLVERARQLADAVDLAGGSLPGIVAQLGHPALRQAERLVGGAELVAHAPHCVLQVGIGAFRPPHGRFLRQSEPLVADIADAEKDRSA